MQTAHWVRRIICSVTPNGAAGFEPASFALVCISEYLYQGLLSSAELRSVVVAQAAPRDGGHTCVACMVMAEVLGRKSFGGDSRKASYASARIPLSKCQRPDLGVSEFREHVPPHVDAVPGLGGRLKVVGDGTVAIYDRAGLVPGTVAVWVQRPLAVLQYAVHSLRTIYRRVDRKAQPADLVLDPLLKRPFLLTGGLELRECDPPSRQEYDPVR